jgi:hypothetical protein
MEEAHAVSAAASREEEEGERTVAAAPICPAQERNCHTVTKENIFLDRAIQKRLERQAAYCPNKCLGCVETLIWKDVPQHLESSCVFRQVECPLCKEDIIFSCVDKHQEEECPQKLMDCPNFCQVAQMKRSDLSLHMLRCNNICPYITLGCDFSVSRIAPERAEGDDDDAAATNAEAEAAAAAAAVLTTHEEESMKEHLRLTMKRLSEQEIENQRLRDELEMRLERKCQENVSAATPNNLDGLDETLRCLLLKHDKTITELVNALKSVDQQMQYSPDLLGMGEMVWKISGINAMRRAATKDTIKYIYSPVFFTHPYGYKLCLRAYINGDGLGKGTHLSLFFVILQGDYDATLQWPFSGTVKMKLLSQDKNFSDHYKEFRSSPNSNSFERPKNERNPPTGFPEFSTHTLTWAKPYYLNDEIYIKTSVRLTSN